MVLVCDHIGDKS